MASSVTFEKQTELVPLPRTERGFATVLHSNHKAGLLSYGSGSQVVVRSVDDPKEVNIFYGHKARVNVAVPSPNGQWVASGDNSGVVLVWGLKNHIVKNEVRVGRKVNDISWSDDGKRLVAGGDGGETKVKAFSWDSSNALGEMVFHSKPVLSCAFKPGRPYRVATASEDTDVGFYAGPPFKFVSSFREHTRFVNCVRYAPDGASFVTVGADRRVFVFDGKEGAKTREIGGEEAKEDSHAGAIYSAAFSPDGKRLLTASADKTAKLWDYDSGALVTTFTFGSAVGDQQVGVAFVGDAMVSLSLNGQLSVLDPESPAQPLRVLSGHTAALRAVASDPASGALVSGDSAGELVVWDRGSGAGRRLGSSPGSNVVCAALLAGGAVAAVACSDDRVRFCDLAAGEWPAAAVDLGGRAVAACPSPDAGDDAVAVVTANGAVLVVRPGGVAAAVRGLGFKPTSVALRAGGAEVAVGGDDRHTHVFSVHGDELKEEGAYESVGNVASVAYTSGGGVLLSGCANRTLLARDAAAGYADLNGGHRWSYNNSTVTACAANPSAGVVVTGALDGALVGFPDASAYGMKFSRHDAAHAGGVSYVGFIDDATLVTGGADNTVRVWTVSQE